MPTERRASSSIECVPLPDDVGVLLIGHGSVSRAEDIPDFVRAIRRGRPTPQSIVDEVTHRWNAIGGSPLQRIVEAQAKKLEARLGVPVATASRLWHPYAKDVVPTLVARGGKRIVSLPLAPYSVHVYHPTTRAACETSNVECIECAPWGTNPELVDAFASVTRDAIDRVASHDRDRTHLLLTAHSLPRAVLASGDAYESQVGDAAAAIVSTLDFPVDRVHVAFQSQGMDGGDWLGPDLPSTLASIASRGGRAVVVTAIGFLADHTEVLYDLDVEARAIAESRGLAFFRTASLNESDRLIDALASVARDAIAP
jgi:ferrochelatase